MKKMSWNVPKLILLGLSLFGMSSCASRNEILQFKDDSFYLRTQLTALRQDNEEIKKQLAALNKTLAALQEDQRQNRADLYTEIETLKSQSQVIDSKLADNTHRMSGLLQRVEVVRARPNPTDSAKTTASKPDSTAAPEPEEFDPKTIYNSAYLDLSRGNYQLAIQGFQTYLKEFPQSEYADNAQYWLGEVYYAQRDYAQAIRAFSLVIVNYPKGDKVAAALLKIGFCYQNMGDLENCKKYLQQVIDRFPNSDESRLAQSRLTVKKK
ncbi:tol-pal system protein YbgF [candidate division KSB1 bacterium]|nr:tol-pal system protein YbgF [candidate division KSB1 bacterium]